MSEIGISLDVLTELMKIWTPAIEAMRLKAELNVRSLDETCAALERAGYEIYRADLPMAVRGFADVFDGRRYILVNRDESKAEQQYTVPHELGHHVLHLNPSIQVNELGLAIGTDREFQADQFASAWLMWGTNSEEQEEVLRRHPQVAIVLAAPVLMTLFVVGFSLLFYVCSRLFRSKPALKGRDR